MPTPPSSLYVDGASQQPAVLPGRSEVEASLATVLRDIEAGRSPRHHGIIGARGMGKTSLLNKFRREARIRGHSVIMLRGGGGADDSLLADLGHHTVDLARTVRPLRRRGRNALRSSVTEMTATLKLGVFTAGVKADPNRSAAARSLTIATEHALELVASELARSDRGLLVMVDEAHAATPSDLRRINGLLETVSAESPNVAFVMAGLPELQGATTNSSFTFVERYAWHDLQPLTSAETGQALRHPLEYQDRTVTDEAVAKAWQLSQGHPHVVQLVARHMEQAAGSDAVVTGEHIDAATARVRSDMEPVYRARWNKLDNRGRDLVRHTATAARSSGRALVPFEQLAIALDQSPRYVYDLARTVDAVKVVSSVSALRLDVPGMGKWVMDNHPSVPDHKVQESQFAVEIPGAPGHQSNTAPPEAIPAETPRDYQRLSMLIEQRAKRAELGLVADPALEAEWSSALQEAGAGQQRTRRFTLAPSRASTGLKSRPSTVDMD